MVNLICGVGVNDRRYPAGIKGQKIKAYELWHKLLNRCYNLDVQKKHPTYIGCSASENFKNYSYFYEWCQNQIGFNQEGYQLDKDLLLRGNKIYSEDTCLFVPRDLNNLLISSKGGRGNLPLGVTAYRGRFLSQCCKESSSRYIGHFNTPEEAFEAYKAKAQELHGSFARF